MATTRRKLLAAAMAQALIVAAAPAPSLRPRKPFKLVMLGDSLTAGLGLTRQQAIPALVQAALIARRLNVVVINAGVSGETSADIRGHLDFSVPADADGVLVAVGANDMLQGLPPSTLRDNLGAICDALEKRRVRFGLAGMRAAENLGPAYRREFDAVYRPLARKYHVPLYPFLLDGIALNASLNQADGIHPNPAGAKIVAARLEPFIVSAFHFTSNE